ncbi:MAG: hypothetical protein Q8880_09695, partial [Bacteroidota bacterium]|nr:hypothetical protein [Bacteroidota bacterium]
MKKIIFALIVVLAGYTQYLKAQVNENLQEADKKYKVSQYYDAIPLYEKALAKSKDEEEKGKL